MNSSSLQKNYSATELFSMISGVARGLEEFCIAYAGTLQQRPAVKKELIDLGLSLSLLDRVERCGIGAMDLRLVMASGKPYQMLRLCPLSDQQSVLKDGVEVWDESAKDVRNIPIEQLSSKQTDCVFANGRLRTITEQRTWCEEKSRSVQPVDSNLPFTTRKGSLTIYKPCRISKSELAKILKII